MTLLTGRHCTHRLHVQELQRMLDDVGELLFAGYSANGVVPIFA